MSGASKILIGSGAAGDPVDDEFNRVSFLSHFDGSNNGTNIVYDDGSASDHTISVTGTPSQGTFGPFARVDGEWSNYFDGDNADLDIASSTDFGYGTGDFTIECFFFLTKDPSASNYILSQGVAGYAPGLYVTSAGHLEFKDWVSGGVDIDERIADDVTINVWHHVAVSRASGTASFYYDGTRTGTNTGTSDFPSSAAVRIGNHTAGSKEFNGYISNFRIVTGTAVYSGTSITVPTSALTAITNTKLLTCQSNRFIDNSASDHAMPTGGRRAVSAFTPILTSEVYDSAVNGASAYFPGETEGLQAASHSDFTLDGLYTIEFFVNLTSTAAQYFFAIGDTANANDMELGLASGTTLRLYQGGYKTFSTSSELKVGSWQHVAVTRNGSDLVTCWVDGTALGTTHTLTADADGTATVGSTFYSGSVNEYGCLGYMSNFRVLNGTCLYTSNFTPPTAPLTAITNTKLLLNMADGQALDSAAQNNLVLYGNADTSTTQYKFGTASLFLAGGGTSSTDFAQMRDAKDITGPFTIECWARSAATTNSYMWCQGQYTMEFGLSGDNLFLYTGTGGSAGNFFTGGEFTVNTWHHVAVVRDTSNVIKCYLNGTASGTTFTNSATFVATSSIFIIGGEWRTGEGIHHGWDGYIDDFRISKFARYTSNFTPSTEAFPDKGQ